MDQLTCIAMCILSIINDIFDITFQSNVCRWKQFFYGKHVAQTQSF